MKALMIVLVAGMCLAGCKTDQTASGIKVQKDVDSNEINPTLPNLSLADYLKRFAGVQVQGVEPNIRVTVRGNSSVGGQNEPLFIIDGANVGFGYSNVAPLVEVNDIQSVRVLRSGNETAPYGMQGNGGVIIITTKRQ